MTRKELVHKLAEHLETAPVYLAAPSFAYQVGDYTIDRHGNILDKEGQEVKFEEVLKNTGEGRHEEMEDVKETTDRDEPINLEVSIPLEGYQGKSLRNFMHIIYSKQPLIKKALGFEEDLVSQEVIKALDVKPMVTLEHFQRALEGIGCPGIDFEKEIITFKLGPNGHDPDKVKAATQLLGLANLSARRLKRNAAAKVIPTDNEKYTFRTWLVRLGMIGDEYKTARNVLLKNLSGNSAFRTQAKEGA
jgi:uncharacterized protein (UPF0216 family)